MKKLITLILMFFAFKVSAQTYTLNYDSVRVGKTAASSVLIPKDLYLKGIPKGNFSVRADGKVIKNDTLYYRATDTASILQTIANFFPKGDTRYSKVIQTYTYTAATSGTNTFTYAPLASATILSVNRSGANYVITGSSPTGLQVQRVTDTFTFVDNFNTSYAETIVIQYTQ